MKYFIGFIIGFIVSIIFTTSSLGGAIFPSKQIKIQASIVKEKVGLIKKGMSKAAVIKILNVPVYIDINDKTETWTFPFLSSVAEAPKCIFDLESGVVKDVIYEF